MNKANPQSLRTYLTSPNPSLTVRKVPGRTNTTNKNWTTPHELREWTDFDIESLRLVYGGELSKILDICHAFHNFADLPLFPFRQVADENSFERFLVKWTQSVITEALQIAQGDGLLKRSSTIYMVSGGQAKYNDRIYFDTKTKTTKKSYPDWAAVKIQEDNPEAVITSDSGLAFGVTSNLLPGDTKISAKWTSASVQPGRIADIKIPSIQPVIQIFNYCLATESRYGYLITDKELFVIRIRPSQNELDGDSHSEECESFDSSQQDNVKAGKRDGAIYTADIVEQTRRRGTVEYKSIPWNMSGEEQLTINLALFWLHILASTDNSIQQRYEKLSKEKMSDMRGMAPVEETIQTSPTTTSSFTQGCSKLALSDRCSSPEVELQNPADHARNLDKRKRPQPHDQQRASRKKRNYDRSNK